MTKQEEIREGLDYYIRYADYDGDEIKVEALTAKILGFLHSEWVGIKVEGELPEGQEWGSIWQDHAYDIAQQDMQKAGYTQWEPLIEVKE